MKKTPFISLLLALLLMVTFSMAVSAAPVAKDGGETAAISLDASASTDSDELESFGDDTPNLQGEAPEGPEEPDGTQSEAEQPETAPAPRKNSNTPYFIGAGIALLVFIGVALYCKTNGNKSF